MQALSKPFPFLDILAFILYFFSTLLYQRMYIGILDHYGGGVH
ncbi:hypothetical protein AT864_03100 [Anoxybacillus sp. P3H1B]|nr:hypothetical protein AT864_03100 [Anoxybacillus sp. P3H1B]